MDTHGHSGELRVANMVARRVQHIPAATHIKVERQRDEQARTRQCRGPALDVLESACPHVLAMPMTNTRPTTRRRSIVAFTMHTRLCI